MERAIGEPRYQQCSGAVYEYDVSLRSRLAVQDRRRDSSIARRISAMEVRDVGLFDTKIGGRPLERVYVRTPDFEYQSGSRGGDFV